MYQITNDAEFKQALHDLGATQQRKLAAMFIEHVLALSDDDRVKRVVKVADDEGASQSEVSEALSCRMAQTSIQIDADNDEMPSHTENQWQYDILSNYLNA